MLKLMAIDGNSLMHRAFYADDTMDLKGEARMENHHPLYLTDAEL